MVTIAVFTSVFFTSPAYAAPAKISVAYALDIEPFQYTDEAGKPAGMIIDFWKLWSQKTGVDVEFVPAAWDDTLTMVRDGKVDAHAGLFFSTARDVYLDFGAPLNKADTHILYHESLPELVGDKKLLPYRVGVIKGDFVEGYLREKIPGVFLETYADYDAMMSEMKAGQLKVIAADTFPALLYLKKYGLSKEFQYKASKPLYQSDWRVAVGGGKTKTLDLINSGMEKISQKEKTNIVRKWSGSEGLQDADTIVIAIDRNYPPFYSIGNDGKPQGFCVDLWKLWAKKTNNTIDFRPSGWTDTLDALKSGEADIHAGLFESRERTQWIDFSIPLYEIPGFLYFRKGQPLALFEDLSGKKVGVIEGTYYNTWVRKNYPLVNVVPVSAPDALVVGLLKEQFDALFNDSLSTDSVIDVLNQRNSIIRHPWTIFTRKLFAGIRKDNPELMKEINDGLLSLTRNELADLESRWIDKKSNRFYSVGSGEVELTRKEEEFLRVHPTIRISNEMDWPPYDFVKDGQPAGYSIDYWKLAASKVGLNLEWVNGYTWSELVQMGKDKKLDVLQSMTRTKDREAFFNFTDAYHSSANVIFTRPEDSSIKDVNDLEGMKVATTKGFNQQELLAKEYPQIEQVEVDSTLEGLIAVSTGKADAFIGRQAVCQYYIKENNVTNVVFASLTGIPRLDTNELAVGVRKDWPVLVGILNKGIAAMTEAEVAKLKAEWFGATPSASGAGERPVRKQVELTKDEKQWLAEHKGVRLGVDPSWPPFEYFMGLTYSGLSAEYIKEFSRDTGFDYAPPALYNWAEVIRLAKEEKIDILPAVMKTSERSKHLAFSKAYAKYPMVVYQQTNAVPIKNMGELDGKTVAVVEAYASEELLRDNHPDVIVQPYRTLELAIKGLSKGGVYALVDSAIAVEDIKQQRSVFNIAPTIKTPYTLDLHFGVRKDWGKLVSIIDKWLDTIDPATHEQLEKAAGINSLEMLEILEASEEPVDYTQLLILGGGMVVVFGLSLIILLFLRGYVRKRAETLYSSHQYKIVGIIVGLLFLCLVVVATWLALSRVENNVRSDMEDTLESVLLTTHGALSIWQSQNERSLNELANDPVLRGLTRALLSLPDDKATLEASPQLWNMRRFMKKAQASREFVEFYVISKNFLNYATGDNEDILDKNVVSIQRPRFLDQVFQGKTIFIPPIKVENDHEGEHGKGVLSLVSMVAPIKGVDGQVIGALILNYDANEDYQRIISLGRVGSSGETYAFDKNGSLVTESRFNDLLQEMGLVEEGQAGMLHLRIADPGGNLLEGHALDKDSVLPYTLSVQSALGRQSGLNIEGYRDYRGVTVFGAWLWDEELGLGMVTEIDEEEALGSFRMVRNTVVSVIFITILLGSLMTGLSNWIGQSAAKSLSKAKDELEDRVEERTAELKKISVAVEQSPAMVFITDTEGTIQYVNPKFTDVTGFSEEKNVGLNPRILKSGMHQADFYADLWETILSGQSWNGDILNKKKDGSLFWVRTSIAPITNDDDKLTHFVAVMEDITDRKAQEERFQALLDAAPDAMVIVAQSGEITLVNIATEELFGYSREEMIGYKVEMLLPDYIREEHPGHRDKFFAAPGNMSLVAGKEFYGQTHKGDQVPVDISLNPIETEDGIQIIASIRDITERKEAEEALREQEQRLTAIIENLPSVIILKDKDGRHEVVNSFYEEATGFAAEDVLGKTDAEFMPPEVAKGIMDADRGVVETGELLTFEEEVPHPDGTAHSYLTTKVPLFDENGDTQGLVVLATDITARKEAEERTRLILSSAGEGIFGVDLLGQVTFINEAACEMLQFPIDELMGKGVHDIIHHTRDDGSFYPVEECPMRHAFTEGLTSRIDDEVLWRKDGTKFPVEYSAVPISRGSEMIGAVISFQDITERKKAEKALRKSEERFRGYFENAQVGMSVTSPEKGYLEANNKFLEIMGYTFEELKKTDWATITHPEDVQKDTDYFEKMQSGELDNYSMDKRFIRKDGEIVYTNIAIACTRDDEGNISLVLASTLDITERKKMEDELVIAKDKAEILSRDFTNFLESTSDLVYLKDMQLRYLACSKPLAEMLGYNDWHEIVGKTDAEIESDKTAINFTVDSEMQVITSGEVLSLEENIIKLEDGRMGWASTIKKPLLDNRGFTVGILSISRDITEMIEMTQALSAAKAETDDALAVVTSSIQYASRIQRSVLPPDDRISRFTSDSFVVWEPRDVVGGDLYWCESWGRGHIVMLGDCTGHGVPGAFMTLLSTGALERSLLEVPPGDSARLISRMHQMIQTQLGQHRDGNGDAGSDDGLELGVCYVPSKGKTITFAGARMPLFIDNGETIEVLKSDKKGIGYRGIPLDFEYTNHAIEVTDNLRFFMTSDGIIDQVGGEKGRGFGKKRFISLLESLRDTPLQKQGEKIYAELKTYEGKEKRRDDVSIIGFKL
ncbi:transporter substrate-binding domain-containing protein [Pseudodesulfovibrio sp.]|nr:transporter substrate-binding domain-containing protein [Pseudodesulfovibrio sp.]